MKLEVPLAVFFACVGCGNPGTPGPSTAQPAASSVAPPPAPSVAPAPPATFDLAAIDEYIARVAATQGFVGLSVAIVKDGTIALDKGYGLRQTAPDLPVQPDTAFEIGSVTKQFVASLVLLLA
jgi:D-alanyl-D-alanine carboxypeptidase